MKVYEVLFVFEHEVIGPPECDDWEALPRLANPFRFSLKYALKCGWGWAHKDSLNFSNSNYMDNFSNINLTYFLMFFYFWKHEDMNSSY
jgi:hypothetical protein